ncbi:hypothetical protein ACHAXT_001378 [Thalassiosira profunda]
MEHAAESPASPRTERAKIGGVNVTLSWPSDDASASPAGVAFLLPGAMISISEYDGLRDVILAQNHLVVSLYINVICPPRNNHRKHAADVKTVFDELRNKYPHLPDSYKVIGHSAGGKIALLLASVVDPDRVSAVLALDPVDVNPVEFTNARGDNLPLDDEDGKLAICANDEGDADMVHVRQREQRVDDAEDKRKHIPIILTCTDGGRGIPKSHNAEAIHRLHPNTICHRHEHAGHMSYTDSGGGWAASTIMPDIGTKEGNEKAKEAAHDLIRQILCSGMDEAGNSESIAEPPRCRFVVTGFGAFAGVPNNPTTVLINRLREAISKEGAKDGGAVQARNISETHILETSAGHVHEQINKFHARLQSDSGKEASDSPVEGAETVIFLHLGVNYKGTKFQLEECAYNDATFRVADERGYQPKGESILEWNKIDDLSPEFGQCLNTTLDVHDICRELQKSDEAVVVSHDPGRFVCNYTYCLSLDRCQSTNNTVGGDITTQQTSKGSKAHSLFVHVPPFDVVPEDRQFEFVLTLMEAVDQQISGL